MIDASLFSCLISTFLSYYSDYVTVPEEVAEADFVVFESRTMPLLLQGRGFTVPLHIGGFVSLKLSVWSDKLEGLSTAAVGEVIHLLFFRLLCKARSVT